jgi:hypothetical protein
MGKERDKLIRRYGGVPLADEHLSDAELMRRHVESYARTNRLPPEIEAIRRKKAAPAAVTSDDARKRPPRD